ncbi:MAG: ankyrin repeat domain-containing protein [Alphaproteobacteria bacterium]|nr:ankyrin repeat domain-containing protein [Alphaproteobacteria bacterium]
MTEDVNANFLDENWWKTATVEDVKAEIAKGADVNARDDFGETVLMYASLWSKDPKLIQSLIDSGGSINVSAKNGRTALMNAITNNNIEMVKMLIIHGANVNSKLDNGNTALMFATDCNCNPDIIKLLIQHNADVKVTDNEGRTPLISAVDRDGFGNLDIITNLVKSGADINAEDNLGWTPLIWSMVGGLSAIIFKNQMNDENLLKIIETIKKLVELGADVNKKFADGTPLMIAICENKDPKIIHTFIELGAHVNVEDSKKRTPLMCAVRKHENPKIVEMLLDAGADINAKDNGGKTALDYAKENKNPKVVELLEEYSKK